MTHNITQAAPVPKQFEVLEDTTPVYAAVVKDENGTALPAASILSITLTYFTTKDGTIINSRDAQDVKNTNNVTIDSSGNLEWTLQAADTAIIDTAEEENNRETHRAIFEYTYGSPVMRGKHVVDVIVKDLAKVP